MELVTYNFIPAVVRTTIGDFSFKTADGRQWTYLLPKGIYTPADAYKVN